MYFLNYEFVTLIKMGNKIDIPYLTNDSILYIPHFKFF